MQEVICLGLLIFASIFLLGFLLRIIVIFLIEPELLSAEDIEFKKKTTIFNKIKKNGIIRKVCRRKKTKNNS